MKPLELNDLTLEQKIGQLIIVRGFLDDEDRKFIMEMTAKKAVGGFQIPYSESGKNERVALAASKADDVTFSTYCRPHSYLGSDGITERIEI